MSLRGITRAPPKRMLVFFEADKMTSILPTSKVKKVLGEGSKLEDGANVIVEYDKVDYEAQIIKLHGKIFYLTDINYRSQLTRLYVCNINFLVKILIFFFYLKTIQRCYQKTN